MIRDEFKNADKKVIAKKSNKKMQQMGERAYYAKKMSTINDLMKPVKFSSIFCTVCFVMISIIYILPLFLNTDYKLNAGGIVVTVLAGVCVIWDIFWFCFYAPYLRKKAVLYKEEMMRLNREYVLKNTALK